MFNKKSINKQRIQKTIIVVTCATTMILPVAASAWNTSQMANAVCIASAADIQVSFTNTETDQSKSMHVVAKDNQTGQSSDFGIIPPQQTKTANLNTGKSSINNGAITFSLSWENGQSEDTKTAEYNAVSCATIIPSVIPTQIPSPILTQQPTETPTITPKPKCGCHATPTPKATVTPTPSETLSITPSPTVTPTILLTPTVTPEQKTTPTPNNPIITIIVQATNEKATPTPTPPKVESAPKAQTLPKTGNETNILFGLASLIPLGLKLRKLK